MQAKIKKYQIVRFIKFGIVGLSGILVNNFVLFLQYALIKLPLAIASPIAIALSILTNYAINSFWTWSDNFYSRKYTFSQGLWRYFITAAVAGMINYGVLLFLHFSLDMPYISANLIGIFSGMMINFSMSDKWVFSTMR